MSNSGHLSNEDAARCAVDLIESGTDKILLAHLSKENNFPQLAYETSNHIFKDNGIKIGKDVFLDVLMRDRASKVFELDK